MAGLFIEFLVEQCAACQSRKSDFGWHRFCFSPCWMRKRIIKAQAILRPVLESPDNFSGPETCFVFALFTFKIKVSIILTMIEWNYHSSKQNSLVCELGIVHYSTDFDFKICTSGTKIFRPFRETGPWPYFIAFRSCISKYGKPE